MSDKKLIAVIGDFGFTSYPLMVACLNSVVQHMGLNPKDTSVINSRCRGVETHAASYCLETLGNDPVAVEMPWLDMSEPCEIGTRSSDGKEYNKLAGVKRDNVILDNPNLVGVVYMHLVDKGKQLTLSSRFPRLVAGSKVPTYIFQLEAKKRNGKRIETLLLSDQAIPDPILPNRDLIRSHFSDRTWINRIRDKSLPETEDSV